MKNGLNKVLILGDGLLGSELIRQTGWDYVSRKKDGFDASNKQWKNKFPKDPNINVVINCIANTDTYSDDADLHWKLNFQFVNELARWCNYCEIKLVHISTDFIYANSSDKSEVSIPVHANNWYSYTKLLGDAQVQLISEDYLLIRESHQAKPWRYDKAWNDTITTADYVDVIAKQIIELIDKGASGVYNVGTEPKTIYDLAKRSNPEVDPIPTPEDFHKDRCIDISKMKSMLDVDI